MSEFDKEAERERLREKYEADQADRETTERMSELLLQGATMTNKHCDRCGDPIFRYQGQEFCPTCQAESQDAQAQTQAQAQEAQTQAQAQADADAAGGTADAPAAERAAAGDAGQPEATQPPQQTARGAQGAGTPESPAAGAVPQGGTADLGEAGEALASTITTLAARAEQTDDPRRAKEFLEAAREAADALAALRQ